jgi:hypothetical protein
MTMDMTMDDGPQRCRSKTARPDGVGVVGE